MLNSAGGGSFTGGLVRQSFGQLRATLKDLKNYPVGTIAMAKLLVPAPEEMLTLWPVDKAVGNVRNNRPELQEPLEGHQPITA